MLRTFLAGAVAAFVGNRLLKMNEEGKFDGLKEKVKDGASRARQRLGEQPDVMFARRPLAPPPAASRKARKSADPMNVSRPAKAHPWPVDPKAMPGES